MLAGDLHTQLVAAGARLAAAGLVRASEGNVSARLSPSTCLVTPTGSITGRMTGAELLEVAIDGRNLSPRATSEVQLHLEVYRRRPDVAAIVHAHPPRVLHLAAAGRLPDNSFLDEDEIVFGGVLAAPYFSEGTRALAVAGADALADSTACVLLDHGAVSVGNTLEVALARMLNLERAAARMGSAG